MNNRMLAERLPEFPKTIITRNGITIEPWHSVWKYRDTQIKVKLDFTRLPITDTLRASLQHTFIWYAENKSPYYLVNLFRYIRLFLQYSSPKDKRERIDAISCDMFMNYRASLSRENEYYIGSMANFWKRMHAQGFPGLDKDSLYFLQKSSFAKNIQGAAVLTMDPTHGPFTEIEFQKISLELHDARMREAISLADFLIVWLFLALGQRPVQYAALKVCDFHQSESDMGEVTYSLQIPRAKQRGEITRSSFKNRIILNEIGVQFVQHIRDLKLKCGELRTDLNSFPLFPAKLPSADAPREYAWHKTPKSLSVQIDRIMSTLKILSERTGAPLKCNPRRFRYTVGTRAAIEGHGELVIAEMLDHSDTQTAGIYVKAVPELIEKFTAKLAFQLAPLANAFKGQIIDPEAESSLPENTYLRIYAPEHTGSMRPTGSCGEHSLCGLMEPLACYTCRSFQPWMGGPHAAVLERLIDERERIQASAADGNTRIASINDLTILAVAEVVRQCEKMKSREE